MHGHKVIREVTTEEIIGVYGVEEDQLVFLDPNERVFEVEVLKTIVPEGLDPNILCNALNAYGKLVTELRVLVVEIDVLVR